MVLLTDDQCKNGMQRVCDMARDIARMSGLMLNSISVDDSHRLTCATFHILQMSSLGKSVTVKIHHEEVAEISDLTYAKIKGAIDRLHLMLEE